MSELRTFAEMIAHIEAGGAAHRFGSSYPLYRLERGELKQRYFSSGGEFENGPLMSVNFSVEEQQSSDWVLVDGEKLGARDEATKRAYQEDLQAKLAAEKKPAPPRSWWRRTIRLVSRERGGTGICD